MYVVRINHKSYFIKRLREQYLTSDVHRALFAKEYAIGSTISHPNIVTYHSIENTPKECYIVMENIVGKSLNKFIESNPKFFISHKYIDKFFIQLLSALEYLHEHHVVFCDLRPENIMISQINNDVKLIDFGFCFSDSFIDTPGMSEQFASPEQIEGGILDNTTDIYAIGKIIEYIASHTDGKLPRKYKEIEQQCLQTEKQKRYQSMNEITLLIKSGTI